MLGIIRVTGHLRCGRLPPVACQYTVSAPRAARFRAATVMSVEAERGGEAGDVVVSSGGALTKNPTRSPPAGDDRQLPCLAAQALGSSMPNTCPAAADALRPAECHRGGRDAVLQQQAGGRTLATTLMTRRAGVGARRHRRSYRAGQVGVTHCVRPATTPAITKDQNGHQPVCAATNVPSTSRRNHRIVSGKCQRQPKTDQLSATEI
jgi:hypothetical protein